MSRQQLLELDLPENLSRENFIVTESNLEAFGWLNQWPEWPHHFLAIYGEEGCGKSHMGQIWLEQAKGTFLDAHEFDYTNFMEEGGHLLIDHAEQITKEEKLFHLYNRVNQEGGTVLLLCNKPPSQWDVKLPDLASRLNAIPCVEVLPPDDALLDGVYHKLFADHQLRVDENVIVYLIRHFERSFKAVVALINELDQRSMQEKKNITLPFVKQILVERKGAN